jgi:hypothetical protein
MFAEAARNAEQSIDRGVELLRAIVAPESDIEYAVARARVSSRRTAH